MDDLQSHYRTIREADRLTRGAGELERLRTQEIIAGALAPPPGKILDVGGGPGAYATWLVDRGYDVTLIDPVAHHVDEANDRLSRDGRVGGRARLGDARSLEFADESQDAVLLLGPLYHLIERADRLQALVEARRVLRPGGVVVAASISRLASLLDGFSRGLVRDPAFVQILERDLIDGQHRNPTDNPGYFTTAYFHQPLDLADEVEESGLLLESLAAVEGPFWCLANFVDVWTAHETRELMLGTLRRFESDPVFLGMSAHVLATGRKPASGGWTEGMADRR